MAKYKAGDKVKVRSLEDLMKEFGRVYGTDSIYIRSKTGPNQSFVYEMRKFCGKWVTISRVTYCGQYFIEEDSKEYYFTDEMFEESNPLIIIYKKGNKVIALDKVTDKTGEAICSSDDEFDFYAGADLAYERLRGRKCPAKKPEPKEKYFSGEIVCIKAESNFFTEGKIYKVKNGYFNTDLETLANTLPYKSIKEINKSFDSQFRVVKR